MDKKKVNAGSPYNQSLRKVLPKKPASQKLAIRDKKKLQVNDGMVHHQCKSEATNMDRDKKLQEAGDQPKKTALKETTVSHKLAIEDKKNLQVNASTIHHQCKTEGTNMDRDKELHAIEDDQPKETSFRLKGVFQRLTISDEEKFDALRKCHQASHTKLPSLP